MKTLYFLMMVSLFVWALTGIAKASPQSDSNSVTGVQSAATRTSQTTGGPTVSTNKQSVCKRTHKARKQELALMSAQGGCYLVDFLAVSSKRSDLRLAMSREGLDVTYSQWLHDVHPDAYQQCLSEQSHRN